MNAEDENKRLFEAHRDEINKRQLSNSESFDKAMLSLSSAGLALSLTFIKFIVPLDKTEYTFFLYMTWWLFGITIICTIISLQISQIALQRRLKYAEEYYLENKEESLNKQDSWTKSVNWLNRIPAVTFILAIISVIIFTTQNFKKEDNNMSKDAEHKNFEYDSRGATIPTMQKVPTKDTIKNGANIPKMQPTQPAEKAKSPSKEK